MSYPISIPVRICNKFITLQVIIIFIFVLIQMKKMKSFDDKSEDQFPQNYSVSLSRNSSHQVSFNQKVAPQSNIQEQVYHPGDLDERDAKILASIIGKYLQSSNSDNSSLTVLQNLSNQLNEEERERLPIIIGRLRSNEDDPLHRLLPDKKVSQLPQDPEQYSSNIVVSIYKSYYESQCSQIQSLKSEVEILNKQRIQRKRYEIQLQKKKKQLEAQTEKTREIEILKEEDDGRYAQQIELLTSKLEEVSLKHSRQISQYQQKVIEAQEVRTQMQSEITQLNNKNQQLESDFQKTRNQLQTKIISQITELKNQQSQDRQKFVQEKAILEDELQNTRNNEANMLSQKVDATMRQLKEVKQINKRLVKQLQDQKEKMKKAFDRQVSFAFEIDDLKQAVQESKQQLEQKTVTIQLLQGQVQKLNELPEMQMKLSNYVSQVEKKNQEVKQVYEKNIKYEKELKDCMEKLEKLVKENNSIKATSHKKLMKKEEENQKLILQLQMLALKDEKNKKYYEQASQQNNKLKDQLQRIQIERKQSFEQSLILEQNEQILQGQLLQLKKNYSQMQYNFHVKKSSLQEELNLHQLANEQKDQKISQLQQSVSYFQYDSLSSISKKAQSYSGQSKIRHFRSFFESLNKLFRKLQDNQRQRFRQQIGFCVSI